MIDNPALFTVFDYMNIATNRTDILFFKVWPIFSSFHAFHEIWLNFVCVMPINNTQNKKGRLTGLCIQPPDDWHFWNSLLQQIEARLGLKAFRKSTGFIAQTTFNFATSAILRIARYYVQYIRPRRTGFIWQTSHEKNLILNDNCIS